MKITLEITNPAVVTRIQSLAKKRKLPDAEAALAELAPRVIDWLTRQPADLTIAEATFLLGVHPNTVKNYLRRGLFPNHYYHSSRAVRIPLADIEALQERRANIN